MTRALLLSLLSACGLAPSPTPAEAGDVSPGARRDVPVQELARARASGEVAVLVDVRTPDEFAEGHVPGALNIPLDTLASRAQELEPHRDAEVWLICRSGARSGRAADQLRRAGYRTVNVSGGTMAWLGAGHPVE